MRHIFKDWGKFLARIQTRDILNTNRSDNHYTVISDIVLELSFPKLESLMEMTTKTTQFLTQVFYPRPRKQVRTAGHYPLLTKWYSVTDCLAFLQEKLATRPAVIVLQSLSLNLKFSNRDRALSTQATDSLIGWKLISDLYKLWGFQNVVSKDSGLLGCDASPWVSVPDVILHWPLTL
jgi:hypothetical protein